MTLRNLILLLFFSSKINAQEIKFSGSVTGYGIIKTQQLNKVVFSGYYTIGFENKINSLWSLNTGIGISSIQYNGIAVNTSIEYFKKNDFLIVPVTIRKYSLLSRRSKLFVEAGPLYSYNYSAKTNYSNTIPNDKKRSTGYSFAGYVLAGFKTLLGNNIFMSLSMEGKNDILVKYKKTEDKISAKLYFLSLGFSKKLSP